MLRWLAFSFFLVFISCRENNEVLPANVISDRLSEVVFYNHFELPNSTRDSFRTLYSFSYGSEAQLTSFSVSTPSKDFTVQIQYLGDTAIILDWSDDTPSVQTWMVHLDAERVKRIEFFNFNGVEGDLNVVMTDGKVDSIIEPNYSLGLLNQRKGIAHGFKVENGNCNEYHYSSLVRNELEYLDSIVLEYTAHSNSSLVPEQVSYGFSNSNLIKFWNTELSGIDPLYLLAVIGYDAIDPNQNLISKKGELEYSYEFDLYSRVNKLSVSNLSWIEGALARLEIDIKYVQ